MFVAVIVEENTTPLRTVRVACVFSNAIYLDYMKNGKLDMMFPVQKSDERRQYLNYSEYMG